MLTDTAAVSIEARSFLRRSLVWGLGLFVLLRLPWTEAHLLLPFVRAQARLAMTLFGPPTQSVVVTLACSGADALVLCCAAIGAYPAGWKGRVAGVCGGAGLIITLNTLRIGSLGSTASPAWFDVLHLYVWPAALTVAIAAYVFIWMHVAIPRTVPHHPAAAGSGASPTLPRLHRPFIVMALGLLVVFSLTSPLYLESAGVLALATVVAAAAAAVLGAAGVVAHASGNVLWIARGGFMVTQECISTPLIPIYLAAVLSFARSWPRKAAGVLATLPLFIALGIVRLLVVALPDVLGSSLFLVHAFYQVLLAAVLVFLLSLWTQAHGTATRTVTALTAGTLFVVLLGPFYLRAVSQLAPIPADDPQGAIAFLPAFQMGLYLALWVAARGQVSRRVMLAGVAFLGVIQVVGLFGLHALVGHTGWTPSVAEVRAVALGCPLVIVAAIAKHATPSR